MKAADSLPEQLGAYRILRLLGEGGSGRVYLAEQDAPRRLIALKVLRSAALAQEAQQRFRREADLLAQLEHPGIARVYAAGVLDTDTGPLPYLAMEYVPGTELLAHAEAAALDISRRLRLLAAICDAVHYAHGRGIVHRDLKPANIVVDAQGRPHILDFGVAHVAGDGFAAMTVAGQVLGTVPYMSPEQLAGRAAPGDPRSDIYALGVIAYQLLAGRLPYPGLSNSTVMEAIAVLRAGRVERLSRIAPETPGDIETIVMKAMAQEADQRYDNAAALAADLERFLAHRPIAARPPTAIYLLGLFVRRHRALSAALAAAILALVGGASIATYYAISEARAHAEAEARATELAAVNRFLNDMLVSADPAHARGRTLTVVEALDAARRQLDRDRRLAPRAGAALAATLADTYAALGEVDTARAIARDALTRIVPQLGAGSDAARRLQLAEINGLQLGGELQAADERLQAFVASPPQPGEDPRLRLTARLQRTTVLLYLGRHGESLQLLAQLVDDAQRQLGADDPLTLEIDQGYTSALFNSGRYDEALPRFVALIARETAALGFDHPTTLLTRMDYAERLRQLGRYDEAEPVIRAVIDDRRRVSGESHYWTLIAEYVLCNILDQSERAAAADGLIDEVVAGLRASLGERDADTLNAMYVRANVSRSLGRYAEAERQYREVIALRRRADAGAHAESLFPVNGLALTLIETGRTREAIALLHDALPRADGRSEHNLLYGRLLGSYGYALMRDGQWPAARETLQRALRIVGPPVLDDNHPAVLTLRTRLAEAEQRLAAGSGRASP
ncbi:serine/threonine-protein kinase [Solimonas flava]|uniref:serine/threonine-protein kinase n=1 Tax=Solimonas flava TaxID=415849 RepID=UPI00041D4CB7|nr:serine/threonine-protein kinase [Solimonas flava]